MSMWYWKIFAGIYLLANLFSLALFGWDKMRAIADRWRIPEKTLFISAAFGPFGALCGMFLFRHKIRKAAFRFLIPLFCLLHAVVWFFFVR